MKARIRDLEIKLINEKLATQNAVTLYRNMKIERDNYKNLYEKKGYESPGLKKRQISPIKQEGLSLTLEMLSIKTHEEESSFTGPSQTHDEIENVNKIYFKE